MGNPLPTTTPETPDTPAPGDQQQAQTPPEGGQEQPQEKAGGEPKLTYEQALAELERTRKEAAGYRVERNELRPLAEKFREQQEANKTEEQKTAEKLAALERENRKLQLQTVRATAATTAGVDAALLKGDSEEEITEHATAIKAAIDQAVEKALGGTGGPGPIVPGENAGGAPLEESDWLRAMFNSK